MQKTTLGRTPSSRAKTAIPGFKRRKLKRGEWVPLDQLGLPGFTLTGPQQEVIAYADGRLVPVLQRPAVLLKALFLHLAFDNQHPLTTDELKYLRKFLNQTQEEFAATTGYRREVINKYESGKEKLNIQSSNNIRLQSLLHHLGDLSSKPGQAGTPLGNLQLLSEAVASTVEHLPKRISITRRPTRSKTVGLAAC